MARLRDFINYLNGRRQLLEGVEKELCRVQSKYETFFAEIVRVRESELSQLTEHILAFRQGRSEQPAPAWLEAALNKAEGEVAAQLDKQLGALRDKANEKQTQADALREASLSDESRTRKKNRSLDASEEALKQRNSELLQKIADYNARIRQLSRGFGFFYNLPKMRTLRTERSEIDREQSDVAAQIEKLRERWKREAGDYHKRETERSDQWNALQTEIAKLHAKIDLLEEKRAEILLRSTIERVLFSRVTPPKDPAADDPKCTRCQTPNPPGNHFCLICAQRLIADKPDFAGSVEEIGELNHHHARFSEGVQATQELIGLVRGLCSGLNSFSQSVADVLESEQKYPLPKLQIDVPQPSRAYGESFERFAELIKQSDYSAHPRVFAKRIAPFVDEVFTEKQIKRYFETMGQELSRQAKRQW
ncbi:MAG: hypothetical protein H6707_21575 [Deltaproteobacteria bacterium]|nr:hypothetical protein [Deltaproteobacteria bacterium]